MKEIKSQIKEKKEQRQINRKREKDEDGNGRMDRGRRGKGVTK